MDFQEVQYTFDSEQGQVLIQRLNTNYVSNVNPKININKKECVYSCDSVESPEGLYINLKTFNTLGKNFLPLDLERSGDCIYLNIRQTYELSPLTESSSKEVPLYYPKNRVYVQLPADATTEFFTKFNIEKTVAASLVALITKPISETNFAQAYDQFPESQYARNLKQIENPPQINLKDKRCADCGNTENLWLHLYDGYIGCGRKFFKIENSGCLNGKEGAAVRHYMENVTTCVLAVKIGSLSPSYAEVYSYIEDNMVSDPLLTEHLLHFGISLQEVEKTEKSINELELEYNQSYEWKHSTTDFTPINHSGAIGLCNISNTCYFNCIIQVFSHLKDVQDILGSATYETLLASIDKMQEPSNILLLQFSKTLCALASDRYCQQKKTMIESLPQEVRNHYVKDYSNVAVTPYLLRHTICQTHNEFNSSRHQDVEEFFRFFLDHFDTYMKIEGSYFLNSEVDEVLEYGDDKKMKLTSSSEIILTLSLPMMPQSLENDTSEQSKRQKMDEICLNDWLVDKNFTIEHPDKGVCHGTLSRYFQNHPPYLCVQLLRTFLGDDCTAKKNSIPVAMPEIIQLPACEKIEIENQEDNFINDPFNQTILKQLIDMNFPEPAARMAIIESRNLNSQYNFESCLDWLIENQSKVYNLQKEDVKTNKNIPKTSKLLTEMGFNTNQIAVALQLKKGDELEALDWLTHYDYTEETLNQLLLEFGGDNVEKECRFIVHMGKNANCGHCVAYIKQKEPGTDEWRWYIFNDDKVGICKDPLINSGYLYFYKKVTNTI